MRKREPLKYRVISEKRTHGMAGQAGERIFILCLSTGQHAKIILNEFIEFKELTELPANLADVIRFTPCDCHEHPVQAPVWLSIELLKHLSQPPNATGKGPKPKRRPTLGAKRR